MKDGKVDFVDVKHNKTMNESLHSSILLFVKLKKGKFEFWKD